MEKKLQVKDLTVSFGTSDGKVQAVRGINFDLYKGETLAIVGESGSGKSVTSKAILGILAGNAIVEGGEIIYDGKDLLKISEDEFHEIRGDKIAMIFQDPMSSLNPIIKIGRQLTEAMILKGKARQKECRKTFNGTMAILEKNMLAADSSIDAATLCKKFDKFEYKHIDLESAYNDAHEAASQCAYNLEAILFEIEKNAFSDAKFRLTEVVKHANEAVHKYVVDAKAQEIKDCASTVKANINACTKANDYTKIVPALTKIKEILDEALTFEQPNFFAMGYFFTYSNEALPELPVSELNVFLRKYLDDNFMLEFIAQAKKGIEHSAKNADAGKRDFIKFLQDNRKLFDTDKLDKKAVDQFIKAASVNIGSSIDKLELIKDSLAYTFVTGMKATSDKYFKGEVNNKLPV